MSKLSAALKIDSSIRIKTFLLNKNKFQVKVPLNGEIDEINKKIYTVTDEEVKPRLDKMSEAFKDSKADNVVINGDDIVVDGKSIKETVTSVIYMERKITEYFRLLVPTTGDFSNITYEDIEAEFPLQIQFELLEAIIGAIQPGYKEAKKN